MIGVTVSRLAATLVAPFAALVLIACGDGEPRSDSGRLVVQKSLAGRPVFIEGSVTHLRIVSDDGTEIVDDVRPIDTLDVPLFDRALPEGTYDVAAVERPCAGNCGILDPPFDATRCELEVLVRADRTTRVAIVLSAASGGAQSDCTATTVR